MLPQKEALVGGAVLGEDGYDQFLKHQCTSQPRSGMSRSGAFSSNREERMVFVKPLSSGNSNRPLTGSKNEMYDEVST